MPYPDGNPTLIEQFEEDARRRFYTDDLLEEAQELGRQLDRITKFLEAYYTGDAQTFVNPDNGELVSANYEVKAFAAAILHGPASEQDTP